MNTTKAIEILDSYNKWRRGGEGEMTDPTELGLAIDCIVEEFKKQWPVAVVSQISVGMSLAGAIKSEVTYQAIEVMSPLPLGANLFTHPQPSDETVKDAERYRWLREQNGMLQHDAFLVLERDVDCTYCESAWVGSDLDHAIDEAMKAEKD